MNDQYYGPLQDANPTKAVGYISPNNQISDNLSIKAEAVINELHGYIREYMDTARGRKDHSIYSGYLGVAITHFYIFKKTKNNDSFEIAKSLIDLALTKLTGEDISFLQGDAGPLAVASVLYALVNDVDRSKELILSLIQLGQKDSINISCSLIDGWSGYLYSLLFVNKYIPNSISSSTLRTIVSKILTKGVEMASRFSSKPPLMFLWGDSNYLGALYGSCGILYTLLLSGVLEEAEIYSLVRPTLDYLIDCHNTNSNYPIKADCYDNTLVQWCHGSPGFVPLFIKASEIIDKSYLKFAIEAANVIWKYGVLKKGYTLCHGVSGNAYSFLALFRKTGEQKYVLRAAQFLEYCLTWPRFEMDKPDRPYSLFKGVTGLLYFLTDVKDIQTTVFPGYEL